MQKYSDIRFRPDFKNCYPVHPYSKRSEISTNWRYLRSQRMQLHVTWDRWLYWVECSLLRIV